MVNKIVEGNSVAEQLRVENQGDDFPVQHIPELSSCNDLGFPSLTFLTELR